MKLIDYIRHDGLGIAELIRNKDISAEEALSCAREAAELVNPDINALIENFAEPLSANGTDNAPFNGVPFVIKDLALHAEGVLNEMGTRLAKGLRTPHDTELMNRFRAAGLRTIARASTPEFGYCPTTEPVANGPTRNPWDLSRSSGGSSGATAASVAAGIVPLAHANDGGGSIRIPAACCGLVGLKPSRGRVTSGPDMGIALSGLAIDFAVTRTVRDCARLLDAVHGPGIGDPFDICEPDAPWFETFEKEPGNLKIACMPDPWGAAPVDAEVTQACLETAALCEKLGHTVEECGPEMDWDEFLAATHIFWIANIPVFVDAVAAMTGREVNEDSLEHTTLACYRAGKAVSAQQLLEAEATANRITRSVAQFFQDYDLLLTPTLARLPAPIGEINANDPNLDALGWTSHVFAYCPFTPLFNMTGQPGISLPLQHTEAGLPIGMQFVARFGDEKTLLQLAREFERAAPWPHTAPLINKYIDQE